MVKMNIHKTGVKNLTTIKFHSGEKVPLEMHKVRIVQKLNLPPIEDRLKP